MTLSSPPPTVGRCPSPVPADCDELDLTLSKYPKLRPLFLMVFLESFGTALTAPVITFFVMDDMHGSSLELGMVGSAFSAAQVLGAAMAGRLSDAYGRWPIVVFSFFWSSVGFFGTAFVHTLPQLMLVRFFAGISGGTWPICQAYAVDVVPEKDRGAYLGLLSAAFAAGFVVGPGLATALLSTELASRRTIFALSGLICLAGAATGGFFLKESLPQESMRPIDLDVGCQPDSREEEKSSQKAKSDWEATNLGMVCMWLLRFSVAFAQYIVYAMYSPLFEDYFGMGDKEMGLMLMTGGILAVFVQAMVFPLCVKHIGEYVTLGLGCVFLTFSLALIPVVRNFHLHIAIMLVYVLAEGYIEPGTPLILAFYALPSHQGFANGVGSAFRGVAAVTAPMVGGELYSSCQACVFSFAAAWGGLALVLVMVARFFGNHVSEDEEEIDEKSRLLGEEAFKGLMNAKQSGKVGKYV